MVSFKTLLSAMHCIKKNVPRDILKLNSRLQSLLKFHDHNFNRNLIHRFFCGVLRVSLSGPSHDRQCSNTKLKGLCIPQKMHLRHKTEKLRINAWITQVDIVSNIRNITLSNFCRHYGNLESISRACGKENNVEDSIVVPV